MNKLTRYGNFSSSNIHKLMSKGRGEWTVENVGSSFNTYIKEKNREIKLQKSINLPANTRPIIWGKVIEHFVFERRLSMEYKEMNEVGRLVHPEYSRWTGVPDCMKKDVVSDIKCPSSLTQFCDLVDSFTDVETFKNTAPEYYWQLVSNAILTNVGRAELIVFVPYENELHEIRDFVANPDLHIDGLTPFQFEFIFHEIEKFMDGELTPSSVPYLNSKGSYKNLNKFEFIVPENDKKDLTSRVKLAINQLIF